MSIWHSIIKERMYLWSKDYSHEEIMRRIENESDACLRATMRYYCQKLLEDLK